MDLGADDEIWEFCGAGRPKKLASMPALVLVVYRTTTLIVCVCLISGPQTTQHGIRGHWEDLTPSPQPRQQGHWSAADLL